MQPLLRADILSRMLLLALFVACDPVVEGPHALAFDGSPDCGTVEVASALEGSFTVEAWLRGDPDAFSDMRPIVLWNEVFNLSQRDDGQVIFTVGSGGDDAVGASYGFTLMDGVLHHVAGAYDAADGMTRLFVDGEFVGIGADTAFIGVKPDDRVQFGCAKSATEGFYGLLDELRISTVPRYADDFEVATAPFKKDDDTLMLFHLDEGTGESATSETGSFEMLITDASWVEFDLAATE